MAGLTFRELLNLSFLLNADIKSLKSIPDMALTSYGDGMAVMARNRKLKVYALSLQKMGFWKSMLYVGVFLSLDMKP